MEEKKETNAEFLLRVGKPLEAKEVIESNTKNFIESAFGPDVIKPIRNSSEFYRAGDSVLTDAQVEEFLIKVKEVLRTCSWNDKVIAIDFHFMFNSEA